MRWDPWAQGPGGSEGGGAKATTSWDELVGPVHATRIVEWVERHRQRDAMALHMSRVAEGRVQEVNLRALNKVCPCPGVLHTPSRVPQGLGTHMARHHGLAKDNGSEGVGV